eukprot:scaffold2053_cov21-Tisochrysis_lutea.AAC.1
MGAERAALDVCASVTAHTLCVPQRTLQAQLQPVGTGRAALHILAAAQLQTVSAERAALDIRASVADRAVQQLRSELDDSRALLAEGA